MKISIDSTEPLADVVRVVEAVYDVTLRVAETNEAAKTTPAGPAHGRGGHRRRRGSAPRAKGNGQRRSAKQVAKVSTNKLRSWARENDHPVSDRGPIPAAVIAAYHQAQDN